MHNHPTDWVTVAEHYATGTERSGTMCILVQAADASPALAGTSWLGSHLGQVAIVDGEKFEDGLADTDRGVPVEFFAQVRRPSGAAAPVPEISHPFLWYWDALPVRDGWQYLDSAGHAQDLVRQDVQADRWKIEVRALRVPPVPRRPRPRRPAPGRPRAVRGPGGVPACRRGVQQRLGALQLLRRARPFASRRKAGFSRLLGRYLVRGARNSRVPRFEEWDQDHEYPEFIYGTDRESGQPLSHTCDPEQLGSYFDKDDTRLHYLTPVYFKREVLQPYAAEPGKYALSATRLSCLGLWGVDISFNSAGLVEVYLGDLGCKLPAAEWGHWKSYNVPPRGKMDEGRFRRDFLNQPANSKDPVGDLQRARARAAGVSEALLGSPVWKPLPADAQAEFESFVGPLSDSPAALGQALLVLTKTLVDGIDPAPLKKFLVSYEKDERSLSLLGRFSEALGGDSELIAVFRKLQGFRSAGGVAHLSRLRTRQGRSRPGCHWPDRLGRVRVSRHTADHVPHGPYRADGYQAQQPRSRSGLQHSQPSTRCLSNTRSV